MASTADLIGIDERLRGAKLRYSSPETSIEDLNRGRPDPDKGIEVIGYYNETPSGGRKANPDHPFVWCCHCGKPTHWKGYVIRDRDGQIFIIGAQNCGRDHYGVYFEEAERVFNHLVARKRALERWDFVQSQISVVESRIEAALRSDELRQIDIARQKLKAASSECHRELLRHIKGRIPLRRRMTERDYESEKKRRHRYDEAMVKFNALPPQERRERRLDGLAPIEDSDPIYKEWTEEYGRVEGGEFLDEENDIRSHLLSVRTAIAAIKRAASGGVSTVQTTKMTRLIADFRKALEAVFGANVRLTFLSRFFEPDNCRRLSSWSNGYDHFDIEATDGGLVITDRAGRKTQFAAFEQSLLPIADELNALAREIDLISQ